MAIEIRAIGGYREIGRNMTAIKIDDEVVIFDMGLHMSNYIKYTEEERENAISLSEHELRKAKAIPDDSIIKKWIPLVKAIIPSHAHLDHVGAIPYMAYKYDCPVIATPFTINVLNNICHDEKINLPNKRIPLSINQSYQLTEHLTVEFINMTHSTPQTVMVALHTKYGIIVYGNDFKLDHTPTLGQKPNFAAIKTVAEKGVLCAIIDVLNAHEATKTPSESVAKEMLRDTLLHLDSDGNILVTTFSSHIARLKSIIECSKKMKRIPVLLGRSLAKYSQAAKDAQIYDFEGVEVLKYPNQVKRKLKQIEKERSKYLTIVTGHQGEPKAILCKLAKNELPLTLTPQDSVVFSCTVIPTDINIKSREKLEHDLHQRGVRMYKDVHVSGHGAREDLRELLDLLKPKHIFPSHGEDQMNEAFAALAQEMGYRNVHILSNGDSRTFP